MKTDAQRKYMKANIRQITMHLNRKTDADILAYLDAIESGKQAVIRAALRAYMAAHLIGTADAANGKPEDAGSGPEAD